MPFRLQPHLPQGVDTITYETQGVREEAVHQTIQEEAQGQEWVTIPIQEVIHAQEEGHQGPMGQEEHSPQEEAIQEAIQAAAAHLQAPRPHNSQEEQAIQVAHRQPHLQDFRIPEDTPIHGRHWTDPEEHYQSFHCLPTTRIAAF